jgi:hypothetical protein
MIKEKAGESVFGNADEALAGKIISRSKKNCGEPKSAFVGGGDEAGDKGINDTNGINPSSSDANRRNADHIGHTDKALRRKSLSPIVKIAIPIALAAIALWILTRRDRDD